MWIISKDYGMFNTDHLVRIWEDRSTGIVYGQTSAGITCVLSRGIDAYADIHADTKDYNRFVEVR